MHPQVTLDEIVFTRSLRALGGRDGVYRATRQGRLVRIGRGAYLEAERWAALGVEGQHLAMMRALTAERPDVVFSHRSAALAWGLPLVGAPALRPEVIIPLDRIDRSDRSIIVHRSSVPFVVERTEGFAVTDMDRTLVDVARRRPAVVSVPMLDHALEKAWTTPERLRAEFRAGTHVGSRRCQYALQLADGRSMSAGESVSRVHFDAFGLPRPELQVRFADARGLIGVVDFWWPELNLIGEFDGFGKYQREEYLGGRAPAEVVVQEKRREDRLRATATRPRVARWGWAELMEPALLRAEFLRLGVL